MSLAARWLAKYIGGLAVDQLTVGGLRIVCQVPAAAFCPDLDAHPEVEAQCLRPLVTEQLTERLTAALKDEVTRFLDNAR